MPTPFRGSLQRARPPFISTSLEGLEQVIPPERRSTERLSGGPKLDKPLPDIPSSLSSANSPENRVSEIIESYMSPRLENISLNSPPHLMAHRNHSPILPDRSAVKPPPPPLRKSQHEELSPGHDPPYENLQGRTADYSHLAPIPTKMNSSYCRDQGGLSCAELRTRDVQRPLYGSSRMAFGSSSSPENIGAVDPSLIPPPLDLDGTHRWRHHGGRQLLNRGGSGISGASSQESSRPILRSRMSEDTLSIASAGRQRDSLLSVSGDFPLRRTLARLVNGAPERGKHLADAQKQMGVEGNNRTLVSLHSSPSVGYRRGCKDNLPPQQRGKQPAIPRSDYQKHRAAAWKIPKLKPRLSLLSRCMEKLRENITQQTLPEKRPLRSLIRSAPSGKGEGGRSYRKGSRRWWHWTLEVAKVKLRMLSRRERRKERLKNQIVMIGPADQFADGRVNHWV